MGDDDYAVNFNGGLIQKKQNMEKSSMKQDILLKIGNIAMKK